ncbi:hypothetical protein Leryth_024897 [Lithospermum erythrorhizon]|nr:hypothetical protein Leryth_024897 [Lithospermum erythrorhizon]
MKEPLLDKLWDINVKASILLLQDAAPYMKSGSSVTALFGLTKALAAEMAPDTRVNCVAPGFVSTHFASFLTDNDDTRKGIEAKTMLNRLGTTEDMAAATAFLASDDASYITGETVVVAGGMQSRL